MRQEICSSHLKGATSIPGIHMDCNLYLTEIVPDALLETSLTKMCLFCHFGTYQMWLTASFGQGRQAGLLPQKRNTKQQPIGIHMYLFSGPRSTALWKWCEGHQLSKFNTG